MNLEQISNHELLLRMQKLVRTERKITHLVLLHISEIEARKLYAEMGYDGMYSYLTRGLGYSEGSAYRRLQSARLLKQVPTLAQKIEDGHLNLTQLTQVQKCIKESSKAGEEVSLGRTQEVLSKLENKNSWETQKTLALEMNLPVVMHEKIQPQKDDTVRLEITLTHEQFAELERAKELLSHICPEGTWSEVIATLAKTYNQKKLQGRNKLTQPAIAAEVAGSNSNSNLNGPVGFKKIPRRYISIYHRRFLLQRANHCCEYQNSQTGLRCSSRYQLEVDHRRPLALGGSNALENLRVLCREHNVLMAQKMGLIHSRAT